MNYKGIIEITFKPEHEDRYWNALVLKSIQKAGFNPSGANSGRLVEVDFECEPTEAPDLLEGIAKAIANPETETYAYRLQWIGERGFGETPMRYSVVPEVLSETPMRYSIGDHDVRVHDLRGKFDKIGQFELLQAEWIVKHPFCAIIKYAVDGVEQEYGIRMDLDKRAFLDDLPDETADATLKTMAYNVWDEVLYGIMAHSTMEPIKAEELT